MSKEDIIKWWSDWYTQETKLVMPEIAKLKMMEQLNKMKN